VNGTELTQRGLGFFTDWRLRKRSIAEISLGQATAVMVMFPPLTDGDPSSAAPSTSSDDACHDSTFYAQH